jgi:hypothetical protein
VASSAPNGCGAGAAVDPADSRCSIGIGPGAHPKRLHRPASSSARRATSAPERPRSRRLGAQPAPWATGRRPAMPWTWLPRPCRRRRRRS